MRCISEQYEHREFYNWCNSQVPYMDRKTSFRLRNNEFGVYFRGPLYGMIAHFEKNNVHLKVFDYESSAVMVFI